MTPSSNLEARMDRIEATLASAGELILKTITAIEGTHQLIQSNAQAIDALAQRIDSLTVRVDSIAASNEQHERILDYLLRKEADRG